MSDLKKNLLNQDEQVQLPVQEETARPREDLPIKAGEAQQQNQQEQANNVEDDFEPAPIVVNLRKRIENWELKFRDGDGLFFIYVCIVLLALMRLVRNIVMPENTIIEISFIAFLTAFLVNYYLVRVGNILPYIENEEKNFTAKLAGFSSLLTIILLLYSFQKADTNSCIFIFVLTWVISYISEKIYYGSNTKAKELGLLMMLTVSAYLLLTPKFLLEYDPATQDGELVNGLTPEELAQQAIDKANDYTNQQQYGLVAALFASLSFSYMCFNLRKLRERDYFTLTHIVCLIVVLFLPIFFPIEGLHSPSLIQWVIMIGLGLVFMLILQLFIRAIQIESPSKLLGQIPVFLGLCAIFDIATGEMPDFLQVLGCVLAFISSFLIFKNSTQFNSKIFNQYANNDEYSESLQGSSGIKGDFIELQNVNNNN